MKINFFFEITTKYLTDVKFLTDTPKYTEKANKISLVLWSPKWSKDRGLQRVKPKATLAYQKCSLGK